MLTLRPDEKILMVIRRHWYVMTGPFIGFLCAITLPSILLVVIGSGFPALSGAEFSAVIKFFLALYILALFLYLFILWANYYLDVWIITSSRLIDINQRSLFVREISEMNIEKIQNVTIEVNGFMATYLRLGSLRVETAGEDRFAIENVPNAGEAKDLLLKFSHEKQKSI